MESVGNMIIRVAEGLVDVPELAHFLRSLSEIVFSELGITPLLFIMFYIALPNTLASSLGWKDF